MKTKTDIWKFAIIFTVFVTQLVVISVQAANPEQREANSDIRKQAVQMRQGKTKPSHGPTGELREQGRPDYSVSLVRQTPTTFFTKVHNRGASTLSPNLLVIVKFIQYKKYPCMGSAFSAPSVLIEQRSTTGFVKGETRLFNFKIPENLRGKGCEYSVSVQESTMSTSGETHISDNSLTLKGQYVAPKVVNLKIIDTYPAIWVENTGNLQSPPTTVQITCWDTHHKKLCSKNKRWTRNLPAIKPGAKTWAGYNPIPLPPSDQYTNIKYDAVIVLVDPNNHAHETKALRKDNCFQCEKYGKSFHGF